MLKDKESFVDKKTFNTCEKKKPKKNNGDEAIKSNACDENSSG